MKKFAMIGLIVAAALAGTGILLCGISAMNGGYEVAKQMMRNGSTIGRWHIGPGFIWFGNDDEVDLEDPKELAKLAAAKEAGEAQVFAASEVKDLGVEIGAAHLVVAENEDDETVSVQLLRGSAKYYDVSLQGGSLSVCYGKDMRVNTTTNAVVQILLPADFALDALDVTIGAGEANFNMEEIACGELFVDVGAGKFDADGFSVSGETDITVGVGDVTIGGGEYDDVTIDCGLGNFEMKGAVNRDLTAECSMGNMRLVLDGEEEDYNYELSCSMGSLEVNGARYTSLDSARRATNPGAKGDIELSCSMGNVSLEFQ